MRMRLMHGVLWVACIAIAAGCSKNDKSTNPDTGGGGGGSTGSFSAQVGAFVATYFTANDEAYSSLDAMLPYVAASLSAQPARGGAPEGGVTCFDVSVAGTTYMFNGTTYVAGPGSAPSNAVRFVLYRLNTSNQPVLTDSIGFIEVRCTVINTRSRNVGFSVVANGLTPLQADGIAVEDPGVGNYNLNGYLAAGGAALVPIALFGQYSPVEVTLGSEFYLQDLALNFATIDSVGLGKRTIGAGAINSADPLYHLLFRLTGDIATETLESGAVYYGDVNSSGIDQLVACMSGGTLTTPTFSAPDASCNLIGYPIGPAMSAANLAAALAGYQALRQVHDVMTDLLLSALALPIP